VNGFFFCERLFPLISLNLPLGFYAGSRQSYANARREAQPCQNIGLFHFSAHFSSSLLRPRPRNSLPLVLIPSFWPLTSVSLEIFNRDLPPLGIFRPPHLGISWTTINCQNGKYNAQAGGAQSHFLQAPVFGTPLFSSLPHGAARRKRSPSRTRNACIWNDL
jgi:hypothetical protein